MVLTTPGGALTAPDPDVCDAPAVSVLSRAFRILDVLERSEIPLGLSDVSSLSGIPKASTYRLLNQLAGLGAVSRRGEMYMLGIHLFALGSAVGVQRRLREAALPFMTDLCSASGQAVQLGIIEGRTSLLVAKVVRGHVGRKGSTGARRPLHATALGKAMLTQLAPGEVAELVSVPMTRFTRYTVTHLGVLLRQVDQARANGVAYEHEELMCGYNSVAAPIGIGSDGVVATLAVAGRTTAFRPEDMSVSVRVAAAAIARACGFTASAVAGRSCVATVVA